MARKKPKVTNVIICDDIREEIGNKLSFIGIYGPDIFVSKIPFTFPKLCFAIYCKDVRGGDSFLVKLKNPSGKTLGKSINGSAPEGIKGYFEKFLVFTIFSPLNIKQEGLHTLAITFNNDDKRKQEVGFGIKTHDKTE